MIPQRAWCNGIHQGIYGGNISPGYQRNNTVRAVFHKPKRLWNTAIFSVTLNLPAAQAGKSTALTYGTSPWCRRHSGHGWLQSTALWFSSVPLAGRGFHTCCKILLFPLRLLDIPHSVSGFGRRYWISVLPDGYRET